MRELRYYVFGLTSCAILIFQPFSSSQIFGRDRDSKALISVLDKLSQTKQDYEQLRRASHQQVIDTIGQMKESVTAGKLPIDVKSQINSGLEEAKNSFEKDRTFVKIPALQQVYRRYVVSNVAGFRKLMASYDRAIRKLPRGDDRRQQFMNEIDKYREDTAEYDSLKVGTKFVGYRSDFDWGPVRRIQYSSRVGVAKLTKIKNDRVKVEFTFAVTKRDGIYVEGIITQNEGRFKAVVRGTYNGINLAIEMVRMIKGADRYFVYQGEVIGNLGLVSLKGIKTNKVATTGRIFLETR